jgi:hypothetical protein
MPSCILEMATLHLSKSKNHILEFSISQYTILDLAIPETAILELANWLERSERSERSDQPTIFWSDFVVLSI